MYCLKKNSILRIESFGGLVIDYDYVMEFPLDKVDTYFLIKLHEYEGLLGSALKETMNRFKRIPNIPKLRRYEIIEKIDIFRKFTILNFDDIDEVWNRNDNFLYAPLELTIYPSMICNLDCKFCFVKNKCHCDSKVSVNDWLSLIKEAKRIGVLSISILGGEPTLYSDIDEPLKGIEEIGISTTITTNGTTLKQSTMEILSNSKYITPVFSIQSLSSLNKEMMGFDAEISLTIIRYFLDMGKAVRINSVYTNQTLEDFYYLIDFCIENKIDRYSIAGYVDVNKNNNGIRAHSFKEIRELDDNLKHYVDKHYGRNKNLYPSVEGCMLYSGYHEYEHKIKRISDFERIYFGCRAGRTKLEIYANGDVYPCICFENVVKPTSNIINSSLLDLWKDDKFCNELRTNKTSSKLCLSCGYNVICNGGCPAINMMKRKDDYLKYKDYRCEIK